MKDSLSNENSTQSSQTEADENQTLAQTRPFQLNPEEQIPNSDSEQTRVIMLTGQDSPAPEDIEPSPEMPVLKGYEDTGPLPAAPVTAMSTPNPPPPVRPKLERPKNNHKGLPWFFYPLLGVLVLLAVLLISGFGGYSAGITARKRAEQTQSAQMVSEQFTLSLQDLEQGAYSRARQRLEYVIQIDPSYPGAAEKLAEVLLELNTTATPTLLPTATLTPTPDLRDVQQRFDQAQQALAGNNWNAAIDELLALRKADAAFRTVEVDGLLFLSLRNRGRDKILKEADLEGGIYDLTLAGKFGPLDAEAQGLLNWSSLYITGASFWEIDWEQTVNYFAQVAPQMPNLMDGSKMTATERYRLALFEYGNLLARRGQYCKAVRAYQESYNYVPDPRVQQAGELAAKGCEGGGEASPQGTPNPNKKPKPTPVP